MERTLWVRAACCAAAGVFALPLSLAEYPPPANDTPAAAEVLGPAPLIVTGRNVLGDDSISSTTLPGLASVPGPDVFYRFTPESTGLYWITMIPWVQAPVYASSGGTVPVPDLCVYVRRVSDGAFVIGNNANGRGRPDTIVAPLAMGVEYEIVVDSTSANPRGSQFEFTLAIAAAPSAAGEDCTAPAVMPSGTPSLAVGTLSGAADDLTFVEGADRCDVAFTPVVAGADRVYEFTTGGDPNDAGDYVISLIPGGNAWDGYVYVVDSCPPFFPFGCLGAANHTSSASRQSESVVVSLEFDTTYYIVVEANTTLLTDAKFTLLVDRASAWEITEVEGNDTPAAATPLASGRNGGQLVGTQDTDYWSIAASAGDKLYAFLDNGNALLSGIDTELRVIDTDGVTTIELDDDDGEGAESPVATLVRRSSSFSATIAGLTLPASGVYYLNVANDAFNTIVRYRLHVGIEPAGRQPTPECEANDTLDMADGGAKEYYSGAIDPQGDVDTFTFEAAAGQRVYIALDGDPERDSSGTSADDPLALDAALIVYDPDGDVLISRHDDFSGVGAQTPDYPAEGLVFDAPLTGTYAVQVAGGDPNSDFGPGRTYELAIFKDNAAPVLVEDVDPQIDSLTPDLEADTVAVTASDDAPGDSGICDVRLAAGSTNLTLLNVSFTPGDPNVAFDVGLADPDHSGSGKLIIEDCAGNTTCAAIVIDAGGPNCSGAVVTPGRRVFHSEHDPIHVPDNQPAGPGINGIIDVALAGVIADVNLTLSCESSRLPDLDIFLESPSGTRIEIITDVGSISSFDITDATFDDDANRPISILDDEPYTGVWQTESSLGGLSAFNGQPAQGEWKLNVIDDASSSTGGARLVRWSLEIDAGFPNPEQFEGSASDPGGIQSVVLEDPNNVQLILPPGFMPGDLSVAYTVVLIDPSRNGSATLVVTDESANQCMQPISLAGLPDVSAPENVGGATRDIEVAAEVVTSVPSADPAGVVSAVNIPYASTIGAVEVDLTISTKDVGRNVATLAHGGDFAALINRVGMDERDSVGLTKDNIEITLSDDAPVEDDAHLEPALGSIEFLGLHQPDGRGEFLGNGIDSDDRDNMLFVFEGMDSAGTWELYAADFREQGATAARSEFRRWRATVISPGGPERYFGRAREVGPQSGICSIQLAGATNLQLDAAFTPPAAEVSYVVSLIDPTQPGSGTVEIEDCAGNLNQVAVSLAAEAADQSLPQVSGAIDPQTFEFVGVASDNGPGDSGIVSVELAPWSDNLELVSVTPDPPGGAGSVDFVVARIDPLANGRGYVRVTDATGWRRHLRIEIDALGPLVSASIENSRRYFSGPVDLPLPDNTPGGVTSNIIVPDFEIVEDVNITFNITHPFADDIDMTLVSPVVLSLFSDIGSTGNDFVDTTLDDEAAEPIPDSSAAAPYTGSFQPEPPAMLSVLDGAVAAGTYTLRVEDDANFNVGTLNNWSLTISAAAFPQRYDGRAEDSRTHDGGICTVELLGGAENLTLTVDPAFSAGDAIVRYSVELTDPALDGVGVLRVTDCAGNQVDEPICLTAAKPPARRGDLDGDGDVDFDDFESLLDCLAGPQVDPGAGACEPCRLADFDQDGDVDQHDLAEFQVEFGL